MSEQEPIAKKQEIEEVKPSTQIKRVSNKKHKPGYKWPVSKRIEVVTQWLVLGNLRVVSEITGVSYGLIRLWRMEDWWRDLEAEIKASRNIQVNSKLSRIVDRSIEVMEDRLTKGDIVWNKNTGELQRIPVPAKEANKIISDMIKSQDILNKQQTEEKVAQSNQNVSEQLKLLAEQFASFNKKQTKSIEDISFTEQVVNNTTESEEYDSELDEFDDNLEDNTEEE